MLRKWPKDGESLIEQLSEGSGNGDSGQTVGHTVVTVKACQCGKLDRKSTCLIYTYGTSINANHFSVVLKQKPEVRCCETET